MQRGWSGELDYPVDMVHQAHKKHDGDGDGGKNGHGPDRYYGLGSSYYYETSVDSLSLLPSQALIYLTDDYYSG